ncbi:MULTISPECIES: hypothetical protein [unclassified Streptomyces]|uniref:hypothetical protein n=1 Tax=unclassified Streptomyces TaxID=2593676 RepID=UPI0016608A80|nr:MULTISPECIES: hypothetical protein [unclassified Streptomyces]
MTVEPKSRPPEIFPADSTGFPDTAPLRSAAESIVPRAVAPVGRWPPTEAMSLPDGMTAGSTAFEIAVWSRDSVPIAQADAGYAKTIANTAMTATGKEASLLRITSTPAQEIG